MTPLDVIIDRGISGVRLRFAGDPGKRRQLEGSIDGFEACRNSSLTDMRDLLKSAKDYLDDAYRRRCHNYWYFRYYVLQVEFVIKAWEPFTKN